MKQVTYYVVFILFTGITNTIYSDNNDTNKHSSKVIIKTYYKKPESYFDNNTIHWIDSEAGEYLEIKIVGEVFDFEIVYLNWLDKTSNLIESNQLYYIKKIQNRIVLLSTYIPEGIPLKRVKWKNKNGMTYMFNIRSSGVSGDKESLIFIQ